MRVSKISLAIALCMGTSVVAAKAAVNSGVLSSLSKPTENNLVLASNRHRHRHCHVTLSLGHMKRKCHSHWHNSILHHGIQFH